MRRLLLDPEGNLRVVALVLLLLAVPMVVLTLAAWGGWATMALIGVLLSVFLVVAVVVG